MKRVLAAFCVLACGALASAHESPVDHVHRQLRMEVRRQGGEDVLVVTYRMVLTERAALLQLRAMDGDGDGAISDAEREKFFAAAGAEIARQLRVDIDGAAVGVKAVGKVELDPAFGQTYRLEAKLPKLGRGVHKGRLLDGYSQRLPGPYVWLAPAPAGGAAPEVSPVTLRIDAPAERPAGEARATITLDFALAVP